MVSKKTTDQAKLAAIGFVVVFGLIWLINAVSPTTAISAGPLLFILMAGGALYIAIKLLKRQAKLDIGTGVIFALVLGGMFWVLTTYPQIAPNFSVAARNTLSLIGVG